MVDKVEEELVKVMDKVDIGGRGGQFCGGSGELPSNQPHKHLESGRAAPLFTPSQGSFPLPFLSSHLYVEEVQWYNL